jgi:hypothetical protein
MSSSKFTDLYYGSKGKGQPADSPKPESQAEGAEGSPDPDVYIGCDYNRNGRPVMGFYIEQKNGTLDGFMYHSINHPKFQVLDGEEFLSFTYSGTAIVMTGTGLRRIFEALMRHTLRAIHEYDGRPIKDGAPVVTRISVTQAVPMRVEQPLELVRPSKQAS